MPDRFRSENFTYQTTEQDLMRLFKSSSDMTHSFIHSGHLYSAPSSHLLLRGTPDYSTDTVSEFHAEAHRQLQVKDLPIAQGPYVAAREGVEPTTLRLKVIVSTKAPSPPTYMYCGQGVKV